MLLRHMNSKKRKTKEVMTIKQKAEATLYLCKGRYKNQSRLKLFPVFLLQGTGKISLPCLSRAEVDLITKRQSLKIIDEVEVDTVLVL